MIGFSVVFFFDICCLGLLALGIGRSTFVGIFGRTQKRSSSAVALPCPAWVGCQPPVAGLVIIPSLGGAAVVVRPRNVQTLLFQKVAVLLALQSWVF